jgi:transcriptional regulator with XRE-family HTH domain
MAHDIGTRLRQVREANALSQRALAKSSGISNATISLIESGKLNPSVAVLKRILEGIPMHLAAHHDY